MDMSNIEEKFEENLELFEELEELDELVCAWQN